MSLLVVGNPLQDHNELVVLAWPTALDELHRLVADSMEVGDQTRTVGKLSFVLSARDAGNGLRRYEVVAVRTDRDRAIAQFVAIVFDPAGPDHPSVERTNAE
jgi:hypothetical protein